MDNQMTRLPDDQNNNSHDLMIRSSSHPVIRSSLFLIRLYQIFFSPWLGVHCRFEPTCSHYAQEALLRHGVVKGVGLAIKRLLRCHPLGGHGYDPL